MTINQRIKEILLREKFDKKFLPKLIGMTSKTINSYIEGDAVPSLRLIIWLFEQFPNLNVKWLFFGQGSMFMSENGAAGGYEERIRGLEDKVELLMNDKLEALKDYGEMKAIVGKLSAAIDKKK